MNSDLLSIIITQIVSSGSVVHALELLKSASWFPWLTKETEKLNRRVGLLVAAITAAGIHFTLVHAPNAAGDYTITVTGLTFTSAKAFFGAYVTQETFFRLYKAADHLGEIRRVLQEGRGGSR